MNRVSRLAMLTGSAGLFLAVAAQAQVYGSYDINGNPGIIDMPNALVFEDAEIAWTFGLFSGTNRGTLNFQILPKLGGSIRYTSVNGLDADGSSSFDMSFDLKYQIVDEQGWRPSVAIGFRDLVGDGESSAEYIVASKTLIGGMSVTGGIGWGRLGSYNGFSNPFGLDTRPDSRDGGGQLGFDQIFRGDAAFFGGLEWETPVRNLKFKAEYSSDDYADEVAAGSFDHVSPFSFGLEYRPWNGVQIGAYYLNGGTMALGLTLYGNPNRPWTSPDSGLGPLPTTERWPTADHNGKWAGNEADRDKIIKAIDEALGLEGISLVSAELRAKVAELRIDNGRNVYDAKAIGRTARIMAMTLPASVETFRITTVQYGMPISTVTIDRTEYESQIDRPDAAVMSWNSITLEDADPVLEGAKVWTAGGFPKFSWTINPSFPIKFYNTSQPVTYDLLLNFGLRYQLAPGTVFSGIVSQHLYGTTDENAEGSQYDRTSRPVLRSLNLTQLYAAGNGFYLRGVVGLLEAQYAGIGGEVLWKPVSQNWGAGLTMAYVRERDRDSYLGLDSYSTVTGLGSLYWDTGWNDFTTELDVGRYVAGDWGGTLTVARRFNNGWEVAAFATLTDTSYDEFGKGAFNKGVRVTIPLRWTLPYETQSNTTITMDTGNYRWGRTVAGSLQLYNLVRDYSELQMYETWGSFWQ